MNTTKLQRSAVCAAVLTLGLAAGAYAQSGGGGTAGTPATSPSTTPMPSQSTARADSDNKAAKLSAPDREFIQKAGVGGMAEVELGQLAQTKASSADVKQFGQRMVEDHGKANQELQTIADSKSAKLPAELDKKHKSTMTKLQKLSGAEFDREYMKTMVSDHKDTVSLFEKQAKSGKDDALKSYAQQTLPALQDHLKMAQSTYDAVKGTKGKAPAGGSTRSGTKSGS